MREQSAETFELNANDLPSTIKRGQDLDFGASQVSMQNKLRQSNRNINENSFLGSSMNSRMRQSIRSDHSGSLRKSSHRSRRKSSSKSRRRQTPDRQAGQNIGNTAYELFAERHLRRIEHAGAQGVSVNTKYELTAANTNKLWSRFE